MNMNGGLSRHSEVQGTCTYIGGYVEKSKASVPELGG